MNRLDPECAAILVCGAGFLSAIGLFALIITRIT